jgi:3-hydroxymyristoyl/3-hydroxydecanoyl-(acyl carrier protein) dehydratase
LDLSGQTGSTGSEGLLIILMKHQPVKFLKQVLPAVKVNVDIGQADPSNYASMFDRVQADEKLIVENSPQNFATKIAAGEKDAKHQDICDVSTSMPR